ncbi:TetR/AcrR family transcriptional regulator [Brachybacterium sp. JB7]|uniref:TetR family transcriptional regulator n=1 Tax=Brachybacterium alimentarium TaxID=47845 RepID=A0A2A3YE73_9MICO|nr:MULTISPECIES: TetR family transcriptional regulator [Brachybacterium]PCC30727.1 TetR family transcriptional regulator [Brachybacterium alimentarium]PCC37568.1 TetR family transcriptional regulator [Brachybacterium alimentarium]RCS61088.1 TetR/AcrR family transcriptional regulator [Brachybacterium alimentarium]RCS67076.1 TetR/AcrR family transcriptional regulator [Brachybacterium sp. JB7]RCS74905.1 TetR/AcrR family transcriptional regulator [Brachybacterium alimentarium]
MPPDATDTKRRILGAARAEFAQFGLAGARVDRIAETGRVNKRSIYVHFGPKRQLFDFVVSAALAEMADEVPFTAKDLPSYAGALFDYLTARPEILRLTSWAGLEREDASPSEVQAYEPKVRELSKSFDGAAVDVLALLLGQITAWQFASPGLRAHASEGPWSDDRLQRHRALLIVSVEALVSAARART